MEWLMNWPKKIICSKLDAKRKKPTSFKNPKRTKHLLETTIDRTLGLWTEHVIHIIDLDNNVGRIEGAFGTAFKISCPIKLPALVILKIPDGIHIWKPLEE